MSATQQVDTSDILGFEFSAYQDKIKSMALSEPSKYFRLREVVQSKVKKDAVENLYKVFFNILRNGTDKDGTAISAPAIGGVGGGAAVPLGKVGYPTMKTNEFALNASATLNEILDELIEIILPIDYKNIAMSKMKLKGEANTA